MGKWRKKDIIYKGEKPVYWSPSSESALAEAEIEYKDVRSPSIYVAFSVVDGKGVLDQGTNVIIWTTTPWTIPANLGIAVHPDLNYAVVDARWQAICRCGRFACLRSNCIRMGKPSNSENL